MKKHVSFLFATFILTFCFGITLAATASTVSLSNVTSSSSQVVVYGDPNAPVELHYGKYASRTVTLGSTDQSGYLRETISTSSYDIACGNTAYVLVNGQRSSTIDWVMPNTTCDTTSTTNGFSFSQNNIIVPVGQSKVISLNGNGSYSVTSNSNPVFSTSISGNSLSVYAGAFGGASITVCDSKSQCGVLYAVAINSSDYQVTSNNATTYPLNFSVGSNNAFGAFSTKGDVLYFTLTTNRSITSVSAKVDGVVRGVSGSGSGPYTVTYSLTGNESKPLPVEFSYSDYNGGYQHNVFYVGPQASVSTNTSSGSSVTGKYKFVSFLMKGDSGDEVMELQKKLKSLGFLTATPNGNFGPATETAVKKFQKTYGITQAGYIGPSTREKLNQL